MRSFGRLTGCTFTKGILPYSTDHDSFMRWLGSDLRALSALGDMSSRAQKTVVGFF